MGLTLRKDKGHPLMFQEVDANFSYLDQRLSALESGPYAPDGLSEITLDQGRLTLQTTRGQTFGPFALDRGIKPQGRWASEEHYQKGDAVQHKNALYVAVIDHQSSDVFEEDKWQVCFKTEPSHTEDDTGPWAGAGASTPENPAPMLPVFSVDALPAGAVGCMILVYAPSQAPKPAYYDGENWKWLYTGANIEGLEGAA